MPAIAAGGDLLLQVSLLGVAAFHLGWVGLIAGTSTAAVATDGLGGERLRGAASAMAGAVRADLLALAWLEVTGSGLLVLVRVRHPFFPHGAAYWLGVLGGLAAGLALLGWFRSDLAAGRHPLRRRFAGFAGVGLAVGSAGLLLLGSGALLQPEQWATLEPAFRVVLTWSGAGRFAEFTLLSFAATGVLLASLSRRSASPDEEAFLRRFGSGAAVAALMAWPLALLFTHFNLPALALSPAVWGAAAAGLAIAAVAAWAAAQGWGGSGPLGRRGLAVAMVALLGTLVGGEQLARGNVLVAPVLAGLTAPPAPRPPAPSPVPQLPQPPAPRAEVAAGKAVFDRLCHLCHRFDSRLVGPPLDAVVPKYRKDPAALRAFIRSPVKKDPAYPAMPKPAVTEAEVDAVAAFLLAEAKP